MGFELEPRTERHTEARIGNLVLRFVTRPISTPAKEGAIALLDGLTAKGNPGREVGVFRNGEWRGGRRGFSALRITPQTWTVHPDRDSLGA